MRRTVIVGDVHGCADELSGLFDRVALSSSDQVFLVGDLVSRGPEPRRVLSIVRDVGGRSVVGNHELKLLSVRKKRAAGESVPTPRQLAGLFETLDGADWSLLESLPLHLDVPEHDVRVVHAGVLPGLPFEKQDPWVLTHIRSVRGDGTPSNDFDGRPWASLYTGSPHLVFGHDARSKLQLWPAATGLDTGCVYGGALSAMVLPTGSRPPAEADRRDAIVSLPARRAYCDLASTPTD
jgi:hypothetical protein